MWAEFAVGSRPCCEGFSSGTPPSTQTNISKFKFDLETVEEEPLCGCATENPIYLFIYLFYHDY